MAVPSAVRRQREKLEAELGLNPDGTPIAQQPDPALTLVTPVNEAAPPIQDETPPAAQAPDSALTARIAELEHLLKTRDGQTSTSMRELNDAKMRADVLAGQVNSLEEAVTELQKQKDTAEARATARQADTDLPSLDEPADLTPEQLEKFGGDSVDFVKTLSKRELLAFVKPLVTKVAAMEKSLARLSDLDRLPQLENVVKTAAADAQRVRDEEFFRKEILAYFPDFETVRETQDWKEYIASDVPGKGIKVGHQLHTYRAQHNPTMIRSVLNGYYEQLKAKHGLSDLAVPAKTQTEGTPVVKPKMKASEYKLKLRDFVNKKLPKAEWGTFKTEFESALNEGRVEMDVTL